MGKPCFWVQPVRLGGFQDRVDEHAGVGPSLGITEEPVFPSDHNRTDGVFHLVIADFNLAVIQKRTKIFLLVQGVDNAFFNLPVGLNMV